MFRVSSPEPLTVIAPVIPTGGVRCGARREYPAVVGHEAPQVDLVLAGRVVDQGGRAALHVGQADDVGERDGTRHLLDRLARCRDRTGDLDRAPLPGCDLRQLLTSKSVSRYT